MKDLFEHIYANKGSIGRWSEHAEGYYVFPKLEGELGPHMKFQGKEMKKIQQLLSMMQKERK